MVTKLRLEDVCDALTAAAGVIDVSGEVLYANPAFKGLADSDRCIGSRWIEDLVVPSDRPAVRHAMMDVLGGRVDVQQVAARLDGHDDGLEWTLVAIGRTAQGAQGVLVMGQSSAPTSFERQQLRDLRYALDQSAIVAFTDQKGKIQYVNDKFCEISKYGRDQLLGQDHRILNSGHHPPEFIRNLWRTIAGGNVWRGELRNRARDGSLYWVDTTIIPFLKSDGKPYQYLAIRYDITERKEVETQLLQQQTLARLGEMSAVIAHEVKNPLAGISGALQIIAGRLDPTSMEHKVLNDAQDRLRDLAGSLEQLLDFARPRALHVAEIDVAELVYDTARLVRADSQFADAKIEVTCSPCDAIGDAQALREAFLNLAINGLQATGGKGSLSMALQEHQRTYSVVFRDDGPGVDPDKRGRIFDPFFSTKSRGTGLGLATVRRTVERHGGTVELECPQSGGSLFRLSLPLRPSTPQ